MTVQNLLLVDDEEDILEFLKYNLVKDGFEVDTAKNGYEAINLAKSKKYDLIILDIMMPGIDGVEVCRHIREEAKQNQESLIAFLTARNEDYTQIAALDSGGDDFITKPIKPKVFLSRVHALLRRSGKSAVDSEPIIKLGDLEINTEKVEVKIKDMKVQLAKKEFELLLLLVSKPGKVFTREEILNRVWGADVIVINRTIDVHIRKLREKIGDKLIKTIKGVGYKFDY